MVQQVVDPERWEATLKACLQELIRALTALEYARSPAILQRAFNAQQELDEWLGSARRQLAVTAMPAGSTVSAEAGDEGSVLQVEIDLLIEEAEVMLVRARRVLAPYRRPHLSLVVGRGDAPWSDAEGDGHPDLTDAEFERLLNACDIPVFGEPALQPGRGYPMEHGSRRAQPSLRLVHSRKLKDH